MNSVSSPSRPVARARARRGVPGHCCQVPSPTAAPPTRRSCRPTRRGARPRGWRRGRTAPRGAGRRARNASNSDSSSVRPWPRPRARGGDRELRRRSPVPSVPALAERGAREALVVVEQQPQGRVPALLLDPLAAPDLQRLGDEALDLRQAAPGPARARRSRPVALERRARRRPGARGRSLELDAHAEVVLHRPVARVEQQRRGGLVAASG